MDRGIDFSEPTIIPVRYSYVDRMKLLYHVHYLEFFEWARSDWIKRFWRPYREVEDGGDALVVVEAHLRYFQPAFYDDLLLAYARPYDWGQSRLEFQYLIRRSEEDKPICTGHTVHCYVDARRKPKPLPLSLREVLHHLARSPSSPLNHPPSY